MTQPTERASRGAVLHHLSDAVDNGFPTPNEISFDEANGTLHLKLDGAADVRAWHALIPMQPFFEQPYPLHEPYEEWLTDGYSRDLWHGWDVHIAAADPITDAHRQRWTESGKAARYSQPEGGEPS